MRKGISFVGIALLACALILGQAMGVQSTSATPSASNVTPGSPDDPLVTKSYVDQRIQEMTGGSPSTGNLDNELEKKLQEFQIKIDDMLNQAGVQTNGNELVVIELFPGDTLIGLAGTEMIVRTGKTSIVTDQDGIPDVTAGTDLQKGKSVPLNHLLLVPRSDGRGIQADANGSSSSYVMVRGGYELNRVR